MRRFTLTIVAFLALCPAPAWADGGTVRLSQVHGSYRITVFTDPTPLRVGLVDVSVLIQDATKGRPLTHLPVTIRAYPESQPGQSVEMSATSEAATNKLFRAAQLELTRSGRWCFEVKLSGPDGLVLVGFEAEVDGPPPAWVSFAPWIGWPAIPIALFAIYQELIYRQRQRKRLPSRPSIST